MTDKKPDPRRPDETFEPFEETRRIPWPVYSIAIALAIWGVIMLVQTSTAVQVADKTQEEVAKEDSTKLAQAAAPDLDAGKTLFADNCATCHGDAGEGVAGAFPPLHGSDVVKLGGAKAVTHIVMRGIGGKLNVNGDGYEGQMPAFGSVLSDTEISEIASYVATGLNDDAKTISAPEVADIRKVAGDKDPFDGGAGLAGLINDLPAQPNSEAADQGSDSERVAQLVGKGTDTVWACASCHGDKGEGIETVPRLAGLPAPYLAKQLHDFQKGTRFNDSMAYVAKGLSDREIGELANYYASMSSPSGAKPSLQGDLKRGAQLAKQGDWSIGVPACFTCHGPSGVGVAPNFPGIVAQQPSYVAHQLAMWAGGARHNSPLGLMAGIGKALNDADRRAVADYLASLAPMPAMDKTELAAMESNIPVREGVDQ
ncbi:cbb3-type cytochrome c oxidase subunit III [Thioclava sp. ES.031]|uniref:c-type cytochrome n=1 Tax=Thioclava sp. ES.031 TaxID=1798203 RepID=UPI000C00515F|nr:c-type cytochrome [Thioclava sp. ES.031]PFG63545.1 cbb3-type cytochrome c oxidase subunit III [Thioclava sp. ES.031]